MLKTAVERVINTQDSSEPSAEVPLGLYVIRGDNVCVIGLVDEALDASIYIAVDTLKYLKKGGRVTPAAAALGTVLNLKPVLTIQGEKLDAFAKVRGLKSAKKVMKEAMEKDIREIVILAI